MIQRTTVRLNPELLRRAKVKAAEEGTTLTALIEAGLRAQLDEPIREAKREKTKIPTFKGDGLMPGVDITNNAALLAILEPDE